MLVIRACLIWPFDVHRVMFLNQVIFECWVTFCGHCSTSNQVLNTNLAKSHIDVFAIIFLNLKTLKITQFIHKFPFGEIILLTDLFLYDCETELFSMNQVYRIMLVAVHSNQYAIK